MFPDFVVVISRQLNSEVPLDKQVRTSGSAWYILYMFPVYQSHELKRIREEGTA